MERNYNNRGFTLLELVIAVVLLSILLAAVYSTFFLSNKAMDGVDGDLLKLQECRMTLDTMGRELESIYAASNKNSAFILEDRDSYGKDTSKITFTSFSPLNPGLSQISYYAEEKNGVITVYKKMKGAYAAGDAQPAELMEGVESFTVEAASANNGKWVKTWNAAENGGRPDAVRVTIKFITKNRPLTLTQTVSPKIGTPLS